MKQISLALLVVFAFISVTAAAISPRRQQPADSIYIVQPLGSHLRFEEVKEGIDFNMVLSVTAIVISVFSIWLPIKAGQRTNRREVFFKMYDVWNSERVIKSRDGFWAKHKLVRVKHTGQIDLKRLYQEDRQFYYDYETIYDVLADLATFYFEHSVDRKLVTSVFKPFINSYANALANDYKFESDSLPETIKMTRGFYKNILALQAAVNRQPPTLKDDVIATVESWRQICRRNINYLFNRSH